MLQFQYMSELAQPPKAPGSPARGVSSSDVGHAADLLLRAGERPTIDKIRAKLGKGSPNTINPLLDAWWKTLSARLDSGPAALHRLPETVAHVAEALWIQALDEGRRRAQLELRSSARGADEQRQSLEVRSHVLTLREGELDSRLRDRERIIADLQLQLRELTLMLRKEQASRESLARQLLTLQANLAAARVSVRAVPKPKTTKRATAKRAASRRTARMLKSARQRNPVSRRHR
jgi:chromosome segregation ATPase